MVSCVLALYQNTFLQSIAKSMKQLNDEIWRKEAMNESGDDEDDVGIVTGIEAHDQESRSVKYLIKYSPG